MRKKILDEAIQIAVQEAHKSNVAKSKHGCVIIGNISGKHKIISAGHNQLIKHSSMFTRHAEESALHKLICSKATVVAAVVVRVGTHQSSRPCVRCQKKLNEFNVRFIFHT